MFSNSIFKAYDIRGIYGKDFDEDFAFKLGAALVLHLKRTKFLVAHDGRKFSHGLAQAITGGMVSAGADVFYTHFSTIPFFNFVFRKLGISGGIMVTASHNTPEYGGFKIFGENGVVMGLEQGLYHIKEIITSGNLPASKYGGIKVEIDKEKFMGQYLAFAIAKSGINTGDLTNIKMRAIINGPAEEEVKALFAKLNIENHSSGFEVAFSFDSDADRLYIFDKDEKPISADLVFALIVRDSTRFWHKLRVVYDLRLSEGTLEKFREWGIRTYICRVGRAFMHQKMVQERADLGGELSGHIYFKENNYFEMPLLSMLRLVKIMARSEMSINDLIKPFQTWFSSGEINIDVQYMQHSLEYLTSTLKGKYPDGQLGELDGITIKYVDWWFNLRPSNTEPLVRLVIEAKTKDLLDEKVAELTEIIKSS